eukprot:SAG31_NODE_36528_length_312_cov_1.070423_1_plen_38_part_10
MIIRHLLVHFRARPVGSAVNEIGREPVDVASRQKEHAH